MDLQTALDTFQGTSRTVREWIEATPRFRDHPEHRPQAYVAIAEAQAMAYNIAVAPRMDNPEIHSQAGWHSHIYTLGTNCQDFRYCEMYLDGSQTYRLIGRRGELKLMLIQVHDKLFGHPDSHEIGNYDLDGFEVGPDGRFEIVLSAEPVQGNWISLAKDSRFNFLQIRRILAGITDDPGELELVREGHALLDDLTDPDQIAERFERAAHFMKFLIKDWAIGLYDMYLSNAPGKNKIWVVGGKDISDILGSPTSIYGLGVYEMARDEALIVEWDPPESPYWSFQLADVWSKSLDFAHYQTDLNLNSATIDDDGKVRLVVAVDDPGVPNWLDPRGRLEGEIIMRDYRDPRPPVEPTIRVVKAAELRDHLPSSTRTVTTDQRQAALAERRTRYQQAFRDDIGYARS